MRVDSNQDTTYETRNSSRLSLDSRAGMCQHVFRMERWTFLTNYGHVFLCLAVEPALRMRDLSAKVGITERSAQRIVADLIGTGYLSCERVGRRNHYRVHGELPLRHPNEEQCFAGALLALLGKETRPQSAADRRRNGARNDRVAKSSSSTRSKRQKE